MSHKTAIEVKVSVKSGNMSVVSLVYKQKSKQWYIHDLVSKIKNNTKFQISQIRTQNFRFKLPDT